MDSRIPRSHAQRYGTEAFVPGTPPLDFFTAKEVHLQFLVDEFLNAVSRLRHLTDVVAPVQAGIFICSPGDAYELLRIGMQDLEQEHLRVLNLNSKNQLLSAPTIYKGSLHTVVVRMPEIFRPAILANASSIIV